MPASYRIQVGHPEDDHLAGPGDDHLARPGRRPSGRPGPSEKAGLVIVGLQASSLVLFEALTEWPPIDCQR